MSAGKDGLGPATEQPCDKRGFGEFCGVFEQQYEIPDFSVAVIAADEIALKTIRHFHESSHIIFVLEGQYISSSGGIEHTTPAGASIFVPAGTTHKDRQQTRSTRSLTISISDSQMKSARHYARMPEAQSDFAYGEITFLANRLGAECRRWRETSTLTAGGLCLEMLGAIANCRGPEERTPPRWLNTARELLHDRCCKPVSISEIARAAGVHPIHLTRTFRKFFKCTPGDYLRERRLETAAALLSHGHAPIAEVALESGFADQSHLCRAFKRKFGLTPAEYRRNIAMRT